MRAFTLAEVLVAAGLLVLLLNFVFAPLEQAQRSSAHAAVRLQALATARQLLEEEPTQTEGSSTSDWGRGSRVFTFRRDLETLENGARRVEVQVDWEGGSLQLARLLPPEEEEL